MSNLTRFGVSIERNLVSGFDALIQKRKCGNRSEAIRDLIRRELVEQEWADDKVVAGAITLIYDHHKRDLLNRLTAVQHDFQKLIIATQHIHLDHSNCLEMIAARGKAAEIKALADLLRSTKGVKHLALNAATTGSGM